MKAGDGNTGGNAERLISVVSLWLLGGIILWFTELVLVLIALPNAWDYKFLRDGMSALKAISLTLVPSEILISLLGYIIVYGLSAALLALFLRTVRWKRSFDANRALAGSLFPAFSLLAIGGLWINLLYTPPFLDPRSLLLNGAFLIFVLSLGYISYRFLRGKSGDALLPFCLAAAFAIGFLTFGGRYIFQTLSMKLMSIKGIASVLALLVFCCVLFLVLQRAFHSKPLRRLTIQTIGKPVLYGSISLAVIAGFFVFFAGGGFGLFFKRSKPETSALPNIVLIVMDAARADHVSCYGYSRETTPNIDSIASEGVVFKNAVSPSSWTLPSHASIFTGLFPIEHGASRSYSYLGNEHESLAQALKAEGYRTLAYSNNPWVSYYTGFHRGFDDFQEGWRQSENRYLYQIVYNRIVALANRNNPDWAVADQGAAKTTDYVNRWMEKNQHSPFFVFINYMETHLPANPPPPFRTKFMDSGLTEEDLEKYAPNPYNLEDFIIARERNQRELSAIRALYDGDNGYLDMRIGQLRDYMRRLNILDDTLFIITSDHGENLGDHGIVGHAHGLFNTLLNVPLIMRYPESIPPGRIVEQKVQTTDIFYTILEAAGIARTPSRLGLGKSLFRRMEDDDFEDIMIAEVDAPADLLRWAKGQKIDASGIDKDQSAVLYHDFKYIQSSNGDVELYDCATDPGETKNIVTRERETALDLKSRLAGITQKGRRSAITNETPKIDEETREKLKSLGYTN